MHSGGFDFTSWHHWLLVTGFIALSVWGLGLSWQWRQERQHRQRRMRLARRLALEIHPPQVLRERFLSGDVFGHRLEPPTSDFSERQGLER